MNKPKILLAILVLLLLLPFPTLAAPRRQGPEDPAELEAFLDGIMAAHLAEYHIPGATLSVVVDGELFLAKGYGYADLETRVPVEAERTLFRPGSVSKLFVWTAVMQLVEAGRLDLHADVNDYLDFEIPATFAEPITLAHLLTHTPGFEDVLEGLFVLSTDDLLPLDAYLKQNLPARVFPPGEVGAYSNYGSALAGYIVERVTGQSFHDYVEREIFAPLGMESTTFRQPLPERLAPEMSEGYNYVQGAYVKGTFELVNAYPAGSASSTATDMARFMIAHLQEGRYEDARILEASTVQEMHRLQFTPDTRLDGMTYGFMETTLNGERVIHHGGDTFLFHSGLFLLPEQNVGLFVSYNGVESGPAREALLQAFMDRYYPAPPAAALEPPVGAAERAARYAGEYHLTRASYTTWYKLLNLFMPFQVSVNEEGYLVVNAAGEISQYVEVEPGFYRNRLPEEASDVLVFRIDDGGQAWAFPPLPFSAVRAPWYATSFFTLALLGGITLLFVGTLLGWPIAFFVTLKQRERRPPLSVLARIVGALFGLWLLFTLVTFIGVLSDVDPAYGMPRVLFGDAELTAVLLALPVGLAVLAGLMLIALVLAWWKGYWKLGGRLHYTLLTLAALGMVWMLSYWSFLF